MVFGKKMYFSFLGNQATSLANTKICPQKKAKVTKPFNLKKIYIYPQTPPPSPSKKYLLFCQLFCVLLVSLLLSTHVESRIAEILDPWIQGPKNSV